MSQSTGGAQTAVASDSTPPPQTLQQYLASKGIQYRDNGTPYIVGQNINTEQVQREVGKYTTEFEGTQYTQGNAGKLAGVKNDVANLGINYQSGGGGGEKSGGASARDLYVNTLETEISQGFKGTFPNKEDYLSNRLGQIGLQYNAQTKTITDPLMQKISHGDVGGESTSDWSYHDIVSPITEFTKANPGVRATSQNVQAYQNNLSGLSPESDKGPMTDAAKKLGSSLGQEKTGYIKKDSSGNIIPEYSSEQVTALLSSRIANKEYGGDTNFLAGNIGTENSTGPDKMGQPKSNIPRADISSLGPSEANQFVLSGKHVLPAGLVYVPSEQEVVSANLAREQVYQVSMANERNRQINQGIDNLVAYDKSIQDLLNAAPEGTKTIDIFEVVQNKTSVFPAHEKNLKNVTALSFGPELVNGSEFVPLASVSLSDKNAKSKIESLMSGGKQITLFYNATETPIASNEANKADQKIVYAKANQEGIYSPIPFMQSLEQSSNPVISAIGKAGLRGYGAVGSLLGVTVFPILQGLNERYTQTEYLVTGKTKPIDNTAVNTLTFAGNPALGLSGVISGRGYHGTGNPEFDTAFLASDIGQLVLFGGPAALRAVPLRVSEAIIKGGKEGGAGLTRDVSLGKALTVGYGEGGSGKILAYKSPEGKISLGTPPPESYFPEQFPVNLSGRGFTRAEGGGLLNKLLNSDQALAYQQSKNILTAQDVELVKAVRDAAKLIPKSPVTVFHPTFGSQPIDTVLTGPETTALKDIVKTGQTKLGLGSQYGSFADIPFVPGKVNVGDLDLAVSSPAQQDLVGTFAQDMLNKATGNKVSFRVASGAKTPGSPLDLVIDNQLFGVNTMKVGESVSRLFKYEEGAVYLYKSGEAGKTKIIDLPIKGMNDEGRIVSSSNKVFGVKEPTKTFNIEGIETLTPHYNTLRRFTTITRQGNKNLKSAIPGFGLTTRYGDYTGMELGRMKDAARAYRGITLAANEYHKIGKTNEAELLESSANIIKRRFQHVFNFEEAINEIRGETVFNTLPKNPRVESSLITKSELPFVSKASLTTSSTLPTKERTSKIERSIKPTEIKSETNLIESKSSSLKSIATEKSLVPKSISPKSIDKSLSSISSNAPSVKPSLSKSLASSENKSPSSNYPSNIPSSSKRSLSSKSPASLSVKSPAGLGPKGLTGVSGNTFLEKNITTDLIPKGKQNKEAIIPGLNTKPDERIILHEATRYNYIGNAPESKIVGLYNRQETIYGNTTINKLRHADYAKTTKGFPRLITSKSVKGITAKPNKLFNNKQKKIRF